MQGYLISFKENNLWFFNHFTVLNDEKTITFNELTKAYFNQKNSNINLVAKI